MASDPNDKTIEGRLDMIADRLETAAGIDPGALRRDRSIPATLKRIADALENSGTGVFIPTTSISFSIQDPENLKTHAGRSTKSFLAWFNGTGRAFTVSRVRASADVDNYTFILYRSASFSDVSTGTDVQLASIACAADDTGQFTANQTSFDSDSVPTGTWLIYEHSNGSAESVTVQIEGSFV